MPSPILDGYLIEARIPARGAWDDVVFKFRPMLQDQVAETIQTLASKFGKERLRVIKAKILEQVKAWDVKKPGSADEADALPVTDEWLSKLPMYCIDEMLAAIQGYSTLEQSIDQKN